MATHSYTSEPDAHNHDKDAVRVALTARTTAVETALVQAGVLTSDQVDELVETYAEKLGPRHGAAMVARAWVDPVFRDRLEQDATGIIREMGYDLEGSQHRDLPFSTLRAVFNTPEVHNVIVCTLCSCYPLFVLGPQPRWYKSAEYRSRMVVEPTSVLKEFGTTIPQGKKIRVWDSNAETRYLVVPERPKGSEGLSEQELAKLVTRDSMIGVTVLPDLV